MFVKALGVCQHTLHISCSEEFNSVYEFGLLRILFPSQLGLWIILLSFYSCICSCFFFTYKSIYNCKNENTTVV